MDLDDLKQKYKQAPMWGRIAGAVVVGLLPAFFIYSNDGDGLEAELAAVQDRVASLSATFDSEREKKSKIPKLEQDLAFTEEQLEKARKSLPDTIDLDDVLQKTAMIAREVGVQLKLFEPGEEERLNQDVVRYVERPVQVEIRGKFHQVATFLDRIAHLETSTFIRQFAFNREFDTDTGGGTGLDADRAKRRSLSIVAKFRMVLFRTQTDSEMSDTAPATAGTGASVPATKLKTAQGDKKKEVKAW